MAEYYAVLSKAIAGLTNASPDTRRAVYDKARNALVSQLRAIEPPLPTSEISRQRLELEEAIRRVEREIQSGTLPPLPARPTQQVLSPPPAEPPPRAVQAEKPEPSPQAPPAAEPGRRSPQEIFRQAILDAEGRGWTAQQGEGGRGAEPPPASGSPQERPRPAARPSVGRIASRQADLDAERVPDLPPEIQDVGAYAPPTAPDSVPPSRAYKGGPDRLPTEPRLAPDYGYNRGSPEPPAPPVDRGRDMRRGPAPIDPEIDEVPPPPPPPPPRRGWGRRKAREDYFDDAPPAAPATGEQRRRRSRVPILLLLFLVLTGGAAFAAWTQLPTLKAMIASFDVPALKPAPATATLAVPDVTPTASTKSTDRLLPPGTPAPAAPATGGGASLSPSAVNPVVTAPAAPAPPSTAANAPGVPATERPSVRIVGDPPPVTTGPAPAGGGTLAAGSAPRPATPAPATGQQQAALTPTPAPSTGGAAGSPAQVQSQTKAVLYEEQADPSQTRAIAGSVVWSYVAAGANGPEISGIVTIPERALKMKITIRRNMDKSLPASHLVELNVDPLAADFPGKAIQTVPTMVFKSSEDGRGDVIVGASATISTSPGFYWIALSNAQRDLSSNLGLLRDRGWIDLRLIYANNQRAILTLEKGASGESAFARAITAWQTG